MVHLAKKLRLLIDTQSTTPDSGTAKATKNMDNPIEPLISIVVAPDHRPAGIASKVVSKNAIADVIRKISTNRMWMWRPLCLSLQSSLMPTRTPHVPITRKTAVVANATVQNTAITKISLSFKLMDIANKYIQMAKQTIHRETRWSILAGPSPSHMDANTIGQPIAE